RSYTAFFSGGNVTVEDLTIANDAGPGSAVGQAIAAYVDAEKAVFRRVRLLGNQDTLFCAPLPEAEREKDGFLGPRKFAPRRPSAQYYKSCEIAGDIDFIFGGADALFEQCILRTVDNHLPHSYITAPSGSANGLGFVFWDCDFVSDCPAGTVYLGRPWRPTGKTAVLDCRLGAHIAPEGFSGWNDRTDTCLSRFAETGSSGPGARQRPDWVAAPSAADAAALLARARKLCRP
uniref:pectinesterase family protein n=1 Tax=Faecalibacterium sp. TaxID=1971605 RepID=UPI00402849F0